MAYTVDAPTFGPCAPWATYETVSACGCCAELSSLDVDLLEINLTIASEILWVKSGRQYAGECTATVRPCCTTSLCECSAAWWSDYGYPYVPRLVSGTWYNVGCGNEPCVSYDCGTAVPSIDLGRYPVTEITEILIDGIAMDLAGNVRVDHWQHLIRTDDERWPVSQDLSLPLTEMGTWSVEFVHGQPPPQIAVSAAAQLACELTKHCQGDHKCALPLRVTSISRQGVSYSLPDVMDVLDRHKTGLYFVDLFLDTLNPDGLTRPPRILSPDTKVLR